MEDAARSTQQATSAMSEEQAKLFERMMPNYLNPFTLITLTGHIVTEGTLFCERTSFLFGVRFTG